MATYYNGSHNQRDPLPQMLYSGESLPSSYPAETTVPSNTTMFMNSGSYSEALVANSRQQTDCIDIPPVGISSSNMQQQEILSSIRVPQIGEQDFGAWRDGRNEMLVMHPVAAPCILYGQENLQGQGLSLSLGTQIPSGIQLSSIQYQNPNPGFTSFLSPNPSVSGKDDSGNDSTRDEKLRNAEYLPPCSFSGANHVSDRGDLSAYEMSNMGRSIPNSKYLKAVQQLLDEVVNVRKAIKKPDTENNQCASKHQMLISKEGSGGPKNATALDPQGSDSIPSELSHLERQDRQYRLTKLLSMLNEVDRKYKQYYHQMQIMISSFDVIAGSGAAKSYTTLALLTISRHFRCLRDAITDQIEATRKSLGEQDTSESNSVGISRLRYVDLHLRQQKVLQQIGMTQQHAWRPQRGLPESSVSVLRAWLFENFLHPYPKDFDKIMLARQTGLTRSQVSNWFINARVRLWKPMVEEMYKEETVEAEMESNYSSDIAAKATRSDNMTSEDGGGDFQQCGNSNAEGEFMDSKPNKAPHVEWAEESTGGANFQKSCNVEAETEYGLAKLWGEERPGIGDCSLLQDAFSQSDEHNDRFMAAASAAYQMSELGRFGSGSGVSLTLGLQHCEEVKMPMTSQSHNTSIKIGGYDDMYDGAASSVGRETGEFERVALPATCNEDSTHHVCYTILYNHDS